MNIEKAIIHTDGGAEPNPGEAAIGATIRDEQGRLIASISERIGRATNNQAEYRAIIAALETVIRLGISRADIYADSELVVRQVNGRYRVRNAVLKPLYQQVKSLQNKLKEFSLNYIPREQNREADRLAARARR